MKGRRREAPSEENNKMILTVYIITGVVIGTGLFLGVYFMGYKTGRKEKIEVANL